jgi:hypothetical protein
VSALLHSRRASAWLRRWRRRLQGPAPLRRGHAPGADVDAAERAWWVLRGFYLVVLHFAFESQRNLQRLGASDRQIDPLWPVAWVDSEILTAAANVIGLAFLASAVAAVLLPALRLPRVLVALLYLQALAFENSFGSINHYGHLGLWLALCFAAVPSGSREVLRWSRARRHEYLAVVFLAQCLAALFYASSGARKAYYGFVVPDGAVSSFAPDALPLLVVQKWLQTGDQPLLAELFMQHLWLAWPVHLLVIYVELFTLVAVFRRELHQLWGGLLISFHLMVWLLLGISFAFQPVLLALIFVWSPFAPQPHPGFRQVLRQLPAFGDALALLRRPHRVGAPRRHRAEHRGGQ